MIAAARRSSAPLGAFADAYRDLRLHGLFPLPLGGADGRKPLLHKYTRMRRPGLATLEEWATQRFPGAGVGIVTGRASGVAVYDVDSSDPAILQRAIAIFGETPLKISTPSGHWHLYYAFAGERCSDLPYRLPGEIKGDGGYVVCPPTVRGSSSGKTPGAYTFAEGSWDDLCRLPRIAPGALKDVVGAPAKPVSLRAVRVGRRGKTLFPELLRHAPACDDLEALKDKAEQIAEEQFEVSEEHPFTLAEIHKAARSAWKYDQEGRNWVGHSAKAVTTRTDWDALAAHRKGGDAYLLLAKLKMEHSARKEPFRAPPHTLARAGVIPGWGKSHQRYRAALALLVKVGALLIVHQGGSSESDARLYTLADQPLRTQPRLVQ